ncbi:cellulase family glycosylhydrolase [[Clostridium] polysaccharolyticum]|uniref:GDSL-like Lipase/Acylhydrolase family protein n=1 Tax=[Clostridium] polysaccharolyticum TaxID=29364 RepID=A0A1I0AH99_9FIRM|nr:cellulase family glycosylhydrolase [[Clostridium] polysaccharolyticum]SES93647.1 GDSL-like Lipase/Acylhydrolase family protein [[Clostridium] polysaccharolyticum]
MKGIKKIWAYILVVAMVLTLAPSNMYVNVKAAADSTYGFHVSGSRLLDANGNPFIIRGINHAHTWYKDQSVTAIDAMAKTGANTIRLVLSNGVQWNKDSLSSVKSLIRQCKENKMIAVLEVHDATGKETAKELLQAADYFVEIKDALIGNEAYVIVNIANEWDGPWESSTWKSGYIEAIKELRNAGIKNTIMVDAAGWGQYPKSIADNGKAVFAADPLGNTMFSTHMYEYAGGSASMVKNNIDSVAKTGLCQVIGEFGWKHTDGDVAEETIMSYCQEKGIGYMAWSWKGNSGGVEYLDLANDWAGNRLSDWGDEIVNGANGLKETSKVCSVFSGNTPVIEEPAVTVNPTIAIVTEEPVIVSQAPEGIVNLFQGSESASDWADVISLTTKKDGGTLDASMITKDGYFTAEYTGTKDKFELIFQSWSGGAGWAEVKASNSIVNEAGNYVAVFTYDDIVLAYGEKFDALDRLYVKTIGGAMVLKSFDYVTGGAEPVKSEAPVISEEPVVSVEPVKSEAPVISEEPVVSVEPVKSEAPVISEEPVVSVEPVKSKAPVVSEAPAVSKAPAQEKEGIVFFNGSKEVSAWQSAAEVSTKKNGGNFDPAVITEDGYFAVTYTGTKDCLQAIFQSWTGGSGWAIVTPGKIDTNQDGSYTAIFDYQTVTASYGTSYNLLDRIYLQTQNGNVVVKSFGYVTGKNAPAVSETPSQEPSKAPVVSKTPVVSAEPSKAPAVSETPAAGTLTKKTFRATESNVKVIGRTYLSGTNERWLANTASGIEFTFTGSKGSITILGDFLATGSQPNNQARFAIYVNDKLFADEMLDEAAKTFEFYNGAVAKVTVKVIKLSESQAGTVGIGDITVTSQNGIAPAKAKAHKIEFIGDSITCGYGIDDENINGGFKNSTEDGSKTYAYKTAQMLDADYSVVSVSGIGVISNYTGAGSKNDENVMPKYYDKLAYSWAAFGDWTSPAKVEWDFSKFQPDAVVINLGTNDSSYVAHDAARELEFVAGYVDFIKQIREKNPDATIFCTLGIMGNDLYPQIEQAVAKYTAQTGDKNVTAMEFDSQQMSDGICVDWHPSDKTNTKAATKLSAYMKAVMGW